MQVSTDFREHPKVKALASKLGMPLGAFFAVSLWAYAGKFFPDGLLPGTEVFKATLEESLGWTGEPGRLVATLLELRLLDARRGALVVHGWAEWSGKHEKRLATDRAAKRRKRAESREARRAPSCDARATSDDGRTQTKKESQTEIEKENQTDGLTGQGDRALLEQFRKAISVKLGVEVGGIAGRDEAGVVKAMAADLRRLGMPCAVGVVARALNKSNQRPALLSFFAGWLREERVLPQGRAGPADPLDTAIELAKSRGCDRWAAYLAEEAARGPQEADRARASLAPLEPTMRGDVLVLRAADEGHARRVRDVYLDEIFQATGLSVEVEP